MSQTRKVFFCILTIFTLCASGQALQVQIYPGDRIYVQMANPRHNYVDLLIHNIVFVNDSTQAVDIDHASVEVLQGDSVVESRILSQDEIQKTTAEISHNGQLATGQFDTDFPWDQLHDQKVELSGSAHLNEKQAAVVKNVFLTVQGIPTAIRIHAVAKDSHGNVEAMAQVPIVLNKSSNQYHFPLHGIWFARSIPNITSHHRWNTQTEFAVDFWKLGENGWIWKTDGQNGADFYGFGQAVLAAADGVVVRAEGSAVQNYDAMLQKKDETDEQFDARLTKYMAGKMKTDPYKSGLGNFIVIQHAGGEYSCYDHLKTASVTVKEGDHVTAGQQIAEVGDTGDTYLVHLHFQISDGPDPLKARSVPFKFADVPPSDSDLGTIMRGH